MGKYFWQNPCEPPIGLNADIERHREEKAQLEELIAEFEGGTDPDDQGICRAYKRCLEVLEQSLAEVVSKLGRSSASRDKP